jgi:hypothetical protein
MMSTAAHTVMATKKPSLVSSEFFIGRIVYFSRLKSACKNSLTRGSLKFFTSSGVPTGDNPAVDDDGDAVGHAEGQVAVVRHHERRDGCGG